MSQGEIAHSCSMGRTAVVSAIKVLVDQGLITRDLRDGNVLKSRKTTIKWDVVAARSTKFRPDVKPTATPAATLAADEAVVATLDDERDSEDYPKKDKDEVTGPILELLKNTLIDHPTFAVRDGERIMRDCISKCINLAGSAESCLKVFEWICTHPSNEGKRKNLAICEKLGGYIHPSFPGWLEGYRAGEAEAGPVSDAEGIKLLFTAVDGRRETGNIRLSLGNKVANRGPVYLSWLKEKAGNHLISGVAYSDEDEHILELEFDQDFLAAAALGTHANQELRPDIIGAWKGNCSPRGDMAVWAVASDRWGGPLKDSADVYLEFTKNIIAIDNDYRLWVSELKGQQDEEERDQEQEEQEEQYT